MLFRGCKKSSKIMFALSFTLAFLGTVLSVLSMFFPILRGPRIFLLVALPIVAIPLFIFPLLFELSRKNKTKTYNQTASLNRDFPEKP
jgi:hypothetical protein